jgi:hypothetical protein
LRRTEAITAAATLLVVLGVVAAAAELGSLPSTPGPSDHHLPAFFPIFLAQFQIPISFSFSFSWFGLTFRSVSFSKGSLF